jgi:hypothetical protein
VREYQNIPLLDQKLTLCVGTDTAHVVPSSGDRSSAPDELNVDLAHPYHLLFDQSTGWIVAQTPRWQHTQLCWLPEDLRGSACTSHKCGVFVIASEINFQLTIIDFTPMLTMLRELGVMNSAPFVNKSKSSLNLEPG